MTAQTRRCEGKTGIIHRGSNTFMDLGPEYRIQTGPFDSMDSLWNIFILLFLVKDLVIGSVVGRIGDSCPSTRSPSLSLVK